MSGETHVSFAILSRDPWLADRQEINHVKNSGLSSVLVIRDVEDM